MIAVIADDFTGAAELAGIGLKYGAEVLISDHVDKGLQPDLLVVYTNSRSMKEPEAVDTMEALTKSLMAVHPSLVYKKIDSVLRGHVLAEVKAQMKIIGKRKALLVPANPSLGRTVSKGQYLVHQIPIHQTGFASDPEYPVRTSDVIQMLGGGKEVKMISPEHPLPGEEILVAEARSTADLLAWTSYREEVFLCGASGFFSCLLSVIYGQAEREQNAVPEKFRSPILLVSGTTFPRNVERIRARAAWVSYLPPELIDAPQRENIYEHWKGEILQLLKEKGKAIIAIGENLAGKNPGPQLLQLITGEIVRRVLEEIQVSELLVEGGATAYAVVKGAGLKTFIPIQELSAGVVRMKVAGKEGLFLTIKPGSYDWPLDWDF